MDSPLDFVHVIILGGGIQGNDLLLQCRINHFKLVIHKNGVNVEFLVVIETYNLFKPAHDCCGPTTL